MLTKHRTSKQWPDAISRSLLTALIAITMMGLGESRCWAGGSIGWEEVIQNITKDDPSLATYITEHFDVAPIGGAVRVGHDTDGKSLDPPYEVGQRIPPYDFEAKPKGAKGDYTLLLNFEPTSIASGKHVRWQMTLRFVKDLAAK